MSIYRITRRHSRENPPAKDGQCQENGNSKEPTQAQTVNSEKVAQPPPNPAEQRSHSRIDLRCPVLLDINGVKCEGETINISESGALIRITHGELSFYDQDDDGVICIITDNDDTCNLAFTVIRLNAPNIVIQFFNIGAFECEFLANLLNYDM